MWKKFYQLRHAAYIYSNILAFGYLLGQLNQSVALLINVLYNAQAYVYLYVCLCINMYVAMMHNIL